MDFTANKFPSAAKEIKWYWAKSVREDIDYSII